MNAEVTVGDFRGNPLAEGSRVEAWLDGERYTATVKEVKPHRAGDGDFRWVVLVREGDLREIQSFSDAIGALGSEAAP